MKTNSILLLILFLFCKSANAQTITSMRYEGLDKLVRSHQDKLLVVNFWATWCEPCILEIPDFLETSAENEDLFDLIFVSLDAERDSKKVLSFSKQLGMNNQIIHLTDLRRRNQWMPKVNSDWNGQIPATTFYKQGKMVYFHIGKMDKQNLLKLVEKFQ